MEEKMKYKMTLIIADPNTPEGMTSDILMKLEALFVHDTEGCGNGHYLILSSGDLYLKFIDLRYDEEFDTNNKASYLEKWARNFWSGKDDIYCLKSFKIIPTE